MESLYLLVPLSIVIVFVAIWIFFGASDSGQFDDLVGPGLRILHDDDAGVPTDLASPEQESRPTGDAHSLRVPGQR